MTVPTYKTFDFRHTQGVVPRMKDVGDLPSRAPRDACVPNAPLRSAGAVLSCAETCPRLVLVTLSVRRWPNVLAQMSRQATDARTTPRTAQRASALPGPGSAQVRSSPPRRQASPSAQALTIKSKLAKQPELARARAARLAFFNDT